MIKIEAKGKTITLKIKYADFTQKTRSKTTANFMQQKSEFFPVIKDLLLQEELVSAVRLLGISFTKLNTERKEAEVRQLKFNFEKKLTEKAKTNDTQTEKMPIKKAKRQATQEQLDHPLHGVKLAEILDSLVEHYGWGYLADEVNINCFKHNPTRKNSLKFLRKMKWAREHVEDIYMDMIKEGIDPKRQKK
jgi:hypothetical protein